MWRPLALECTDCCHKIQLQAQKRVYTVHVSICVFHMFTILFNTHIYQYCYICISICIHHFFLIVVPACNLICRVVDVSRGHTVPLKRMLLSTSCSTFGQKFVLPCLAMYCIFALLFAIDFIVNLSIVIVVFLFLQISFVIFLVCTFCVLHIKSSTHTI